MANIVLPHQTESWEEDSNRLLLVELGDMKALCSAMRAPGLPGLEEAISIVEAEVNAPENHEKQVNYQPFDFFGTLLPFIQREALAVRERFPQGLPSQIPLRPSTIELGRDQVLSLMAACFFGWFGHPRSALADENDEEAAKFDFSKLQYPGGSFGQTLRGMPQHSACLIFYFYRCMCRRPPGNVTFRRMVERDPVSIEDWVGCTAPLLPIDLRAEQGEGIEDADGYLQADFANEMLGGGVLQGGNVQEEIRFCVSPECIVGRIFCPKMLSREAIVIEGTERMSKYKGYGGSFEWDGLHLDTDLGEGGAPISTISALDALVCWQDNVQFTHKGILRELNKSFVAFHRPQDPRPVATGNWGCGLFGGDTMLKSVIQWMACSRSGVPMAYYPFDQKAVRVTLQRLSLAATGNYPEAGAGECWTVGRLASILFGEWQGSPKMLHPYLLKKMQAYDGVEKEVQKQMLAGRSKGSAVSGMLAKLQGKK